MLVEFPIRIELEGNSKQLQEVLDMLADAYRNDVEEAKFVIEEYYNLEELWVKSKKEFKKYSGRSMVLYSRPTLLYGNGIGNYGGMDW